LFHVLERFGWEECSQQLVVAGAALVGAGNESIDDAQAGCRADLLGGEARAGRDTTLALSGILERSDNRRPHCNHSGAAFFGPGDGGRGVRGYAIRLVEG